MEENIEIERMDDQQEDISFIIPNNYLVTEDCDGTPLNLVPLVQISDNLSQPTSIANLGKQLLKASEAGNVDEIKLLMHRGAPFTADWLGISPLHFAAQNNHLDVCKILLSAGISKDARTKVDRTPLHLAVYYGHVDIVKCLIANNADIDCKDMLWMTPLHWAAQLGNATMAKLLVQNGATCDILNRFDLSATDIALQIDRHDIVKIINTPVKQPEEELQEVIVHQQTTSDNDEPNSPIPLETIIEFDDLDSENSIDPERLHMRIPKEDLVKENYFSRPEVDLQEVENNEKLSANIKFLQQHGITMLPADDTNIISSILETGRSVTLTEVGKQVFNSTKPVEMAHTTVTPKLQTSKKIILPQDYVQVLNESDFLKQLNGKIVKSGTKPSAKRIVMKKNKTLSMDVKQSPKQNKVVKSAQETSLSDVDDLRKQLAEANRIIEEYKRKYSLKVAEVKKYKMLLLAQSKNLC